jgi:hypothetical protein
MRQESIKLKTKLNIYVSPLDEEMMFAWLDKIPCVLGCKGIGVDLYINLRDFDLDDNCLRELIGVFFRYELDLFELKQFETEKNRNWFRNVNAYWYPYVFEGKSSIRLTGGEHRIWWDEIVGKTKDQSKNR